jgi:hypothetical protein
VYQAVCFASFSAALGLVTREPEATAPISSLFAAGCLSGACTVIVTTPTDLVKIKLQLQQSGQAKYTGMLHCARSIIAAEGLAGIYRSVSIFSV